MPLRSFSQAETILTERRRLEGPLLATVWTAVAAFAIAEESVNYFVLATAAVGPNLLAAMRGKELYLRRLFIHLGLLGATLALALEAFRGGKSVVIVLAHFLILIQLCKLFEQKRNRDYIQLLTMSLLLVIASSLLSISMFLAGVVVLYLALLLYTAMLFTLKRGLDAASSQTLYTEPRPLPVQQVAWNVLAAWPARPLRTLLALALTVTLLSGAAAFVLAPRTVQTADGLLGGPRKVAEAGFPPTVELGLTEGLYLSDRIVMRVRLSLGGHGVSAAGPAAYLRGAVFENYSQSRWNALPYGIAQADRGMPPGEDGGDGRPMLMQEVVMDSRLLPTLFTCYPAARVSIPQYGVNVDSGGSFSTRLTAGKPGPVKYTVFSWSRPLSEKTRLLLQRAGRPPLSDPSAAPAMEVTAPVAELARQWCQDLVERRQDDPGRRGQWDLRIASRLVQRLGERCQYSLEFSGADVNRDGVEDFLFHLRRGHCEYFASALTVMCHSLGVRARLATGFHLSETDNSGQYIVRSQDAHAWTEIFTGETDWVPFDASPAVERPAERNLWQRMRDLWQDVNLAWHQYVAGYDYADQRDVFSWLSERLSAFTSLMARQASAAAQAVAKGVVDLFRHGQVDRALMALAAALGLIGLTAEAIIVGRAVYRRRKGAWGDSRVAVPRWQLRFVSELFAVLHRRGLPVRPAQTARSAAAEAARTLHLPPDVLSSLIDLYYRLRWGGQPATPEEIQTAEAAVRRVEATAAESSKAKTRRSLGEGGTQRTQR